jgi:hypothetical protein
LSEGFIKTPTKRREAEPTFEVRRGLSKPRRGELERFFNLDKEK